MREYEEFCDGDLDVGEHPSFHEWLMAKLHDEREAAIAYAYLP